MIEAWFHAGQLFPMIDAHTLSPTAVKLFVETMILTVFASGGSAVATMVLNFGLPKGGAMVLCTALVMAGMFTAWVCFMIASLIASVLGHLASRRSGRNCLSAAL